MAQGKRTLLLPLNRGNLCETMTTMVPTWLCIHAQSLSLTHEMSRMASIVKFSFPPTRLCFQHTELSLAVTFWFHYTFLILPRLLYYVIHFHSESLPLRKLYILRQKDCLMEVSAISAESENFLLHASMFMIECPEVRSGVIGLPFR